LPHPSVTIRDVAAHSNVSHQTVSRVINNSDRVSPETRAKVEAAIEELGYRPNFIARSIVQGRTYTLGCISPSLTDYIFAKMIDSAQIEAQRLGFFTLTGSAQTEAEVKLLLEEMLKRRIDGLLMLNPRDDARYHHLLPLIESNIPLTYLKNTAGDAPVSSITCDGLEGGYQATKYLIGLGHTSIATILGLQNEEDARDRLAGYRRALIEAGIQPKESLIINGKWTSKSGLEATKKLLATKETFSAIFTHNDRMAMGAIRALRESNIRVPQDISIIGFDDAPIAPYLNPPLTTMRQPIEELGQRAAQLLIKSIQYPNRAPEHVCIQSQLIERESCASVS